MRYLTLWTLRFERLQCSCSVGTVLTRGAHTHSLTRSHVPAHSVHTILDGTVQYKEYERSAEAAGHVRVPSSTKGAQLTCCVNPNNPTGGYRTLREMQDYIEEHSEDHSHVIVDESMQPWLGPHWRSDSLTSDLKWLEDLERRRNISGTITALRPGACRTRRSIVQQLPPAILLPSHHSTIHGRALSHTH